MWFAVKLFYNRKNRFTLIRQVGKTFNQNPPINYFQILIKKDIKNKIVLKNKTKILFKKNKTRGPQIIYLHLKL